MKNKFCVIGVAYPLSYTGTFMSYVSGVGDKHPDPKITTAGGSKEKKEFPHIDGKFGQGGDYELKLMCNGKKLTKKLISKELLNQTLARTWNAVPILRDIADKPNERKFAGYL